MSGSAIGYYGDRGDEKLTEKSTAGDDFLARLCVDWEAAAAPAAAAGIRVATIRTGIVLAPGGGALDKLLPLFKLGLGGRMGSGRQYWSWITIDDEVRAIRHLLDHDVSGPVNLTAPEPATNQEITEALGEVLHRPTLFPVPRFGPKIILGGEATEAFLYASQRVFPKVLEADGFTFIHPDARVRPAGRPRKVGSRPHERHQAGLRQPRHPRRRPRRCSPSWPTPTVMPTSTGRARSKPPWATPSPSCSARSSG